MSEKTVVALLGALFIFGAVAGLYFLARISESSAEFQRARD